MIDAIGETEQQEFDILVEILWTIHEQRRVGAPYEGPRVFNYLEPSKHQLHLSRCIRERFNREALFELLRERCERLSETHD